MRLLFLAVLLLAGCASRAPGDCLCSPIGDRHGWAHTEGPERT